MQEEVKNLYILEKPELWTGLIGKNVNILSFFMNMLNFVFICLGF